MARKPTESESRKETISYRVTRSFYNKVINRVEQSGQACLSDYARTALIERMQKEDKKDDGK